MFRGVLGTCYVARMCAALHLLLYALPLCEDWLQYAGQTRDAWHTCAEKGAQQARDAP